MRVAMLAILILSLALAGCGGSSDDSSTTTGGCSDTASDGSPSCTTTNGNTTPPTPNVPPVLVYTIKVAGVAGNVSNPGTNVTIEATGSVDNDGDGLDVIAVAAKDSNRTYPSQLLYFNGDFAVAKFKFDLPGVVNVTIAAADKRGDTTVKTAKIFVDEKTTVSNSAAMTLAVPTAQTTVTPTSCKAPSGQSSDTPIDSASAFKGTFRVLAGTQYVVAKVAAGMANIALCDSTGTKISTASTDTVTSTKGTVFIVPAGTASYYVEAYSTAPNQAVGVIKIDVTVHYEAQP